MYGSQKRAIGRRALVMLTVILLAQLLLTTVSSASGACPCVYTVQRGDTLSSIARRFGVTVSEIVQANCICNPNLIFVGQRLVIPCPSKCPTVCLPVCQEPKPEVCPPPKPAVCPTVACPSVCPPNCIYIVQRGDTLTKIAARFGTTVAVLMRLNGICNPNLIFAGQRLRVC